MVELKEVVPLPHSGLDSLLKALVHTLLGLNVFEVPDPLEVNALHQLDCRELLSILLPQNVGFHV